MRPERGSGGTYRERVSLDDVLGVFDTVEGPAITSSDVAEILDCSTDTARRKLSALVEDGRLATRETGRTRIYWRTESGSDWEESFGRWAESDLGSAVADVHDELDADLEDRRNALSRQ